ncbi:MAG: nicotinate phosphoribosyltransferase [Gemmatimonadota bacterium]
MTRVRTLGSPDGDIALLTDQYELTMLQAYWREEMFDRAVFSLFVRRLPAERNYLLTCGLDSALDYLEGLRFSSDALDYLSTLDELSAPFLDWLAELHFTGDVYAVPEGTPVFANEPLLEVVAPLPEAQLVETLIMNQIHFQTVLASKAARVVTAARGRTVVDFGLRRMYGVDAGLKAARAFHIAGVDSTSNLLAGMRYGFRVSGTMAHSYVQAHEREEDAFAAFAELYPGTILLLDTYDTLEAVRKVIALARAKGQAFDVRGVRLDSGDLGRLAVEARRQLDAAGLDGVSIFASGGLDEYRIARLVEEGAPISGFGVGTAMAVSSDAPGLDMVYKLTAYAGRGRLKLSPGKETLPGRKQVYRLEEDGEAVRDVIAEAEDTGPGRPLLRPVMRGGVRLPEGETDLDEARERARSEIARLPQRVRSLVPAEPPYPVAISEGLLRYENDVSRAVG